MAFRVLNTKNNDANLILPIDGYVLTITPTTYVDLSATVPLTVIKKSLFDGALNAFLISGLLSLMDGYTDCETLSLSAAERMIAVESGFFAPFTDMPRHRAQPRVESSPLFITYATIDGEKNILTALGKPCRRIRVGTAGTLVLTPSEPGAADCTIDCDAGESLDVSAITIKATSTAAKVTIYK